MILFYIILSDAMLVFGIHPINGYKLETKVSFKQKIDAIDSTICIYFSTIDSSLSSFANMTLQDAKNKLEEHLLPVYGAGETRGIFFNLLEALTGLDRNMLISNTNRSLNSFEFECFENCLQQLIERKPLQYVIGTSWFGDLKLYVDERVLIPRPETEELVDWMLKDNAVRNATNLLDIGTGSGCIALLLKKKLSNLEVWAADISESALEVVKRNSKENSLEVNLLKMDVLQFDSFKDLIPQFDVIVSNPPYIPYSDKETLEAHVLNFEPHLALFAASEDPLQFYRAIGHFALAYLKEGGHLYFELHAPLANATIDLLVGMGFENPELKLDMQEQKRMLKLKKTIF